MPNSKKGICFIKSGKADFKTWLILEQSLSNIKTKIKQKLFQSHQSLFTEKVLFWLVHFFKRQQILKLFATAETRLVYINQIKKKIQKLASLSW